MRKLLSLALVFGLVPFALGCPAEEPYEVPALPQPSGSMTPPEGSTAVMPEEGDEDATDDDATEGGATTEGDASTERDETPAGGATEGDAEGTADDDAEGDDAEGDATDETP